jgi:hypothetical protein
MRPWRTVREAQPRCGGRWLSLITVGHRLVLHTGEEAEAVLAVALTEA